ncbi:alpha/beta hydrolase [Chryseobacterium sp. GMJ5]|uniref:Alpha/beta hydrolase n=1 Tax=Chryseobacterium gilvum TaxID=2976534 RepID=A0ABT2VVD2_9FLAO|nr:alpha/beta hydrolase [Chryseobacterium gilvum]MCU7613962.1 alpha/beta hydrolase [Chryseobacterium gilvum]
MSLTEKGYQSANGIQFYYEMYGSGKSLVLIHGGGSSFSFDYKEIIPRLESKFQLIGIDLQNHGLTAHRDIPETFEQDADDVAAVLKQLKIKKASFWGFSNGGNTVMQIAHRHPEIVNQLIVASAFYKRSGIIDGFFGNMMQADLQSMPEMLKNNFLQLNPDISKLENMFEKDCTRMQTFKDWDEKILTSIKAKTLFISGDQDVMKPEHAAEMWRWVKDARLMILPATHGSYMMADFNGNVDKNLIDTTVNTVEKFLD